MRLALAAALLALLPGTAAGQECQPDLVNWTPTPTLMWNGVPDEDLAGYRLYWRWLPDGGWCCYADLPCQFIPDEDAGGTYRLCPGEHYSVAPQKYTNTQLWNLSFAVKAYDVAGNESVEFSNEVEICMPQLWRF